MVYLIYLYQAFLTPLSNLVYMPAMPPDRHDRAHQLVAPGFGKHFTSPQKVRNRKKTTTRVTIPGQAIKHQQLLEKLKALQFPVNTLPKDMTPCTDSMDQSLDIDWPPIEHPPDQSCTTDEQGTPTE